MKVKDIMTKDVICVDKDEDLYHILSLMKKHDITKVPVFENKKLIGIATDNMIAHKLGEKRKAGIPASRLHASLVTERQFEAISPDTDVSVIIRSIGEPGPTMLPVVEGQKLVGIVTKADLLPLVTSRAAVITIIQAKIYTVSPDDRIIHARRIMLDKKVARLPVVDHGKLIGMISDREIAFAFASLKRSVPLGHQKHQLDELLVRDVMKIPAISIPSSSSIADAATIMLQHNVGALVVIEHDSIIGIVTRTDLLMTLPKNTKNGHKK